MAESSAAVTYSPAGQSAIFKPGTLLACHGDKSLSDRLIRFGEELWLPKHAKKYSWANHIACVTSTDGDIVEMLAKGATAGNASKYEPIDYAIIDPGYSLDEARRAVAVWLQAAEDQLRYGWLTDVSIGMRFATRSTLQFGSEGRPICSGLGVMGLCATSVTLPSGWRTAPNFVSPAEVMWHFGVEPPISPAHSAAMASRARHPSAQPGPIQMATIIPFRKAA